MTSVLEPTDKLQALVVTPEEYEALPENRLLELVDGVVRAMTPANLLHQELVDGLKGRLRQLCPPELKVVREQELRIRDDLRRVPDLMVIAADEYALQRYWLPPEAVTLAIEVVSPTTQTADRVHKPGEYAAAGIEFYWRVEPRPVLEIHTFQLGPTGTYAFTGRFVEGDVVAAPGLPWAKVPVGELLT
ncbi:Uma2 family endonuclease [Hamadaea tsunoensis]|uniref:Uma2 family endonuclease n=1 Tax=Hamadaea tsunoensis TaxID=53368 RepID=UPI000417D594|nr:Uma2 family endonuclease [Hamadaea tsunoensis]